MWKLIITCLNKSCSKYSKTYIKTKEGKKKGKLKRAVSAVEVVPAKRS